MLTDRLTGDAQQEHQRAELHDLGFVLAHQMDEDRHGQDERADEEEWIQERHMFNQ